MKRKSILSLQKKTPRADDAMYLATTVASLGKELSAISGFPPAAGIAAAVMLILDTVQQVKTNREACFRLARRAANILVQVNAQMVGRWESAPQSLLKNLEKFRETLAAIHRYTSLLTDVNWRKRFLKKSSIEDSITDFEALLNDAAEGFQIATLISIHYAIRDSETDSAVDNTDVSLALEHQTAAAPFSDVVEDVSSPGTSIVISPSTVSRTINLEHRVALEDQPDFHFDTYTKHSKDEAPGLHFKQFRGSELLIADTIPYQQVWWCGLHEARVGNQTVFVKKYEARNGLKHWLRDVQVLQRVFHPSFPQLFGTSRRNSPFPFILLVSAVEKTPQQAILDCLCTLGIGEALRLIVNFYEAIQDVVYYIQERLELIDGQIQEFFESASLGVDKSGCIVLGLPESWPGCVATFRNHGLFNTVRRSCVNLLPQSALDGTLCEGTDEETNSDIPRSDFQEKAAAFKLGTLVLRMVYGRLDIYRFLQQSDKMHEFLDQDVFTDVHRPGPSRTQIPERVWRKFQPMATSPNLLSIGDFGYVPDGEGIESFVVIGNVFKDQLGSMDVAEEASGACWLEDSRQRIKLNPSDLPDGTACWPITIQYLSRMRGEIVHQAQASFGQAWELIFRYGESLAKEFNVRQKDIRLVTGLEFKQDFDISYYDCKPQEAAELYLLTSLSPERTPYLSETPNRGPKSTYPPLLSRPIDCTIRWGLSNVHWIQLGEDDVEGT